jgi:sugar phosphate isomerase/epimerase
MSNQMNRRGFFETSVAAGLGLGVGCGIPFAGGRSLIAAEASKPRGTPNAEKLGWQLTCTAYSLNQYSFNETVDALAGLGLGYVEGFSWQPVDKANPQVQCNHDMPPAVRSEVKKRLADQGVKLVGCYYTLPKGDDCRKVFEWAKELGLDYLVAEPTFDAFDPLDKLCEAYQITLAIHNHAKPNPYWNPEVLVEHLKGHSRWLRACCDTGHWVRSGLDPVAMLQKVGDLAFSFHLKDLPEIGQVDAGCVPFGTGKGNIEGILAQARRQGFRGVMGIEYEPYTAESLQNVARCVANFEKMAAKLAAA